MLFATEGFESFNAVIRSFSIHSNHRAPSRDIALGMAQHNRVQHFLSSGFLYVPHILSGRIDDHTEQHAFKLAQRSARSPWLARMSQERCARGIWRQLGSDPLALLSLGQFEEMVLGTSEHELDTARAEIGMLQWCSLIL